MKKWLPLIATLLFLGGIQSCRAADACADGFSKYGKVSCLVGNSEGDEVLVGYFYGAGSLEEIEKNYSSRFEKFRGSCRKKVAAATENADAFQMRLETVDVCNGKRGYQEPCTRNDDCIERFCHPVRGTCSAVFTVPMPFGN